ncbi:hypothetical protein [Flavobacterium faecale]|uniref:hypothetical protein n=1 Tax=Flavobacterium faecale TaxID=1355330 RepID=UPI003AAB60DE
MQNPQELKLIDGTYLPKEATEILLNLYDKKINFHELKDFSTQVCTGSADSKSVQRIPELKADVETIKMLIQKAESNNQKLTIKSIIHIDLEQN